MMKRKVLIPLDGSDFSRQILPHVRNFLVPADNELILYRVAQPPAGLTGEPPRPATAEVPSPMYYESARESEWAHHPIYASQAWDSFLSMLEDELQLDVSRLQGDGYTVSAAVGFGDPVEEIVEFVENEEVDLVTMATHGRTGLSRLIFGSVADRVLRKLTVPVMLVRPLGEPVHKGVPGAALAERLAQGKPIRITLATDGSPFARAATRVTGDLARALNAEVTTLAVSREEQVSRSQEILDEARDLLGELEPAPKAVPLVGVADEVVIQHLTESPVDLLVIGPFDDRGATQFPVGSTAQRLLHHAPTSVLMVKDHQPTFERILACTGVGDEVVVAAAAELASALGAELKVLHVVPPSAAMYMALPDVIDIPLEEMLDKDTPIARHLKACINKLETDSFDRSVIQVRRGTVPDTIFQEAREGTFDLIVVGSQAGPVRDRYFIGSIADRVVKYAHRSVLIVRTTQQ